MGGVKAYKPPDAAEARERRVRGLYRGAPRGGALFSMVCGDVALAP
jgi:hypothetical protein